MSAPFRRPLNPRTGKVPVWIWVLPFVSCFLLGFVPPIVVAAKARTQSALLWATGIVGAFIVGFGLAGAAPDDSSLGDVGAVMLVGATIAGLVFVAVEGPKVSWGNDTAPPLPASMPGHPPVDARNAGAVATVMQGRQKRAEARALAASDPWLARELRIGRPDLQRRYDDGGLVDVNSAPAPALAQWLGLDRAQAEEIVQVRGRLGRFERIDDLIAFTSLEPRQMDQVVDRIIVL